MGVRLFVSHYENWDWVLEGVRIWLPREVSLGLRRPG